MRSQTAEGGGRERSVIDRRTGGNLSKFYVASFKTANWLGDGGGPGGIDSGAGQFPRGSLAASSGGRIAALVRCLPNRTTRDQPGRVG